MNRKIEMIIQPLIAGSIVLIGEETVKLNSTYLPSTYNSVLESVNNFKMPQKKQEQRSSSTRKEYISTYQSHFTGEFGRPSGSARYVSRLYVISHHGCSYRYLNVVISIAVASIARI